jgi:hypothetical protein
MRLGIVCIPVLRRCVVPVALFPPLSFLQVRLRMRYGPWLMYA